MEWSVESVPPHIRRTLLPSMSRTILPKPSAGSARVPATTTLAFGATNGGAAGIVEDEDSVSAVERIAHLGGAFGSGTLLSENQDLATGTSARETGEDAAAGGIIAATVTELEPRSAELELRR